ASSSASATRPRTPCDAPRTTRGADCGRGHGRTAGRGPRSPRSERASYARPSSRGSARQGRPAPGTSTVAISIRPLGLAFTISGWWVSAVATKSVRRSAPPSMHAKGTVETRTRSTTVPPACTRSTPLPTDDARRRAGRHEHELRRMERGRGVQVEAEVPDVGAAPGVDDHVVAVEGGERGEIGGDGEATRVETEEAPVGHRYDQQAAVGEPAEPRRLTWHLDHGLRSSGEVDRHHAMRVHVREPELPRMPSRALGKDETIEEHPGRGRHALHSARCAAAGN